jgi:hypothetical protein
LRAHSVPAAIIDIRTRLVKDWPWRASILDTGESNLIASCFMLNSRLESLAFAVFGTQVMLPSMMIRVIHELVKIAVTMWAKHVEVAKGQEGITKYALCTRRQGRRNELLIRGTRGSRFGAEVGLGIVVIGLKVGGHVVGCAHVLCRS